MWKGILCVCECVSMRVFVSVSVCLCVCICMSVSCVCLYICDCVLQKGKMIHGRLIFIILYLCCGVLKVHYIRTHARVKPNLKEFTQGYTSICSGRKFFINPSVIHQKNLRAPHDTHRSPDLTHTHSHSLPFGRNIIKMRAQGFHTA